MLSPGSGPSAWRFPGAFVTAGLRGLRARYRLFRRRGHRWLEEYPRLQGLLRVTGCLHTGREYIARGIAVGMFVGLTPTVGFQTGLMIAGCVLLRGNFPSAFAVSWVSNPVTMAPLYWAFHSIGEGLRELTGLDLLEESPGAGSGARDELLRTAAGSLLIALPTAVLTYLLVRWLLQWVRR